MGDHERRPASQATEASMRYHSRHGVPATRRVGARRYKPPAPEDAMNLLPSDQHRYFLAIRAVALTLLATFAVGPSLLQAAPAQLSPAQVAAARPGPQGRNIEEIRIVGNDRFDTDTISFYMASRAGAPFDVATAELDYMSLFNTNWFHNVVMSWEEGTNGGVVLILEVDELPLLRQVRIEGTGKVSMQDFFERLALVERSVRINDPIDEQLLRDNIEVLTFMLQGDDGLQFVQIDLEVVPSELGAGVDAVYRVIEGDSVRIGLVQFEGNTVFSDQQLRWAMKRTAEHHFMSFLSKSDRYSRAAYEFDIVELSKLYHRNGYLEFDADDPRIEVFPEDRSLWFDDRDRLAITIPIYEGTQYHIGEITIEGNTEFSDAELIEEVGLRRGDVLNIEEVQAANQALSDKYTNAGYLQVAIAPMPYQDPSTGTANLTYQVQENAIYHVNRIEFSGNTNTRDFVLRRNLNLHEQARWDQRRFDTSIERLWRLGYFQNVEHALETAAPGESLDPAVPADPQFGSVDVDVRVAEIGRNQISFGGGLSALEGGFVQFGYSTRNLFGYGQTLSLFGQVGKLRQNVRLSFSDPYFLGKRVRFGADIFRDAIDFPAFQRSGTGGAVRFGLPLNLDETVAAFLEYNYEVIDIGNVSSSLGSISSPLFQALFLTRGRRVTSSVRPFMFHSNLDNPFLASRGSRTSASFEYAGGPLGGTLDFWRANLRTTWYIPTVTRAGFIRTPKQILVLNVRADYAEPLGELEELPIFERFFLGGSNSVRGTRLRSIGPIDEFGNILGGTKGLQYNIEYIFSLTPALRVKGFHDAGQAWLSDDKVSIQDMRRTAGLEFEIFAPVFNVPMRFFWAYNFRPLEIFGEQKSTFEFAIGSTF